MSSSHPPPILERTHDSNKPAKQRTHARRVCIVSGGGDAPGVNAIVRGFVHAAHRHSIDVFGCRYGFEGLTDSGGITRLSLGEVRGILPRGGCILGCSTRINPFFAPIRGGAETRDLGPAIGDRLKSMDIAALVLIGGDGTMLAARRFMDHGIPCIGIPKTIDNDLPGTDVTCGFDSAVETATHAIDALHCTAEAHARVMVVEVIGRNAGWIALHAGMAGGADVILIPEIPYRIQRILAKIREREALGLRFSVVVIAEGARPNEGDLLEVALPQPGFLPRLGGAGTRLVRELEAANIGHEVRLTVLGHLQRGGSPSAFDRNLGTQMGTYAAGLCREGALGRRVVVRDGKVTCVPMGAEMMPHKRVDVSGSLAKAARLVGIELGDTDEHLGGPAHCVAEPRKTR